MKVGDVLICKKNYYGEYSLLKKLMLIMIRQPEFVKNEKYVIRYISENPSTGTEFYSMFLMNALEFGIISSNIIKKVFYTNVKELRNYRN